MHANSVRQTCFSMTGFARSQCEFGGGALVLELRSVNSRFLDLSLRLPDELRGFESVLREKISAFVLRGKVECRLTLQHKQQSSLTQVLPEESVLARLHQWQTRIRELHPDAAPLSVADLLRWPGVLAETDTDLQELSAALLRCLEECLKQFQDTRQREGQKLASVLQDRCTAVTNLVRGLQPKLPALRETYQKKALEKLSEALGMVAPHGVSAMCKDEIAQRLSTEVAMYVLRADVDEEIERLMTHVKEVQRVLSQPGSGGIGKRLDFLMQELHREANTLGSKSLTLEMSNASLELKVLIEQMREQVQNIE
ncbi:MAG: YicC family protein [Burkholderiales bacterium]|nr:YicC family protein [Burkholderiales bacterium]